MRWQLELVSGPEQEAVTLAEMKLHLSEYASTDRDAETNGLIKSAREWIEEYTGRVLMDETIRLSIDWNDTWLDANASTSGFVDSSVAGLYLRRSPILEIVSVNTVDSDGAETLVAASEYELRAGASKFPFLVPTSTATWQALNLRITFRAGFADLTGSPQDDASAVPEQFKVAMKLYAKWLRDLDKDSEAAAHAVARTLKAQVGFA